MSRLVDLTPPSCRRRLRRRRAVRQWITGYAAVGLALATSILTLGLVRQSVEARVEQLERQVELDETQQRHASLLRRKIKAHEARIARHDRLAWPVDIATLIAAIGEVTPERVALTSLAVQPKQDRSTRTARGRTAPHANSGMLVIEVRGMAREDMDIAEFVAGLEGQRLFDSVTVDYARSGERAELPVREFGLTCTVDLAPRYELVQADGGATP